MAGVVNLYDSDGVKQRQIGVDDTTKRVEIRDSEGKDIMDIEAHASRHADGGDDPLPDGSISTSMIKDNAITTEKIATGAVTVNDLAVHLGEVDPIPDTATFYEFPYTLPADPKQAIVTETTTGVMGYVQVDAISRTGITLVANVSGVTATVTVLL